MTVSTTANSATWTGNGATSTFTYSFYIPATASYSVVQTDTSGNQTTLGASAYTITGIGSIGGTLTLNGGPLTTGYRLTLARSVPLTQPTSLSNQGGLWPSVVEQAIDNVVLQVQQLAQQYGSAITFNPADTTGPISLPVASTRAGNLLAFDQTGQVTVVSLAVAAAAGTTYPAAVSAALPQTPTGTGALVLQNGGTLINATVGTQSPSDNSTKAASTAYVTTAVATAVTTAENAAAAAAAASCAALNGSSAQTFSVADATAPHHAVALDQFTTAGNSTARATRLPDGTYEMSGIITITGSGTATFYTPFPTAAWPDTASVLLQTTGPATPSAPAFNASVSTTGITIYIAPGYTNTLSYRVRGK